MKKQKIIKITVLLIVLIVIIVFSKMNFTLIYRYLVSPYIFINKWGKEGTEYGQFKSPAVIVIDSKDDIYILDNGNNRIQKFNSQGNFLGQWGKKWEFNIKEEPAGYFNGSSSICIDNNDNIYVSDYGNARVQVFDIKGNFKMMWDVTYPSELAVDIEGNTEIVNSLRQIPKLI